LRRTGGVVKLAGGASTAVVVFDFAVARVVDFLAHGTEVVGATDTSTSKVGVVRAVGACLARRV
jgi:hypothetical protein